MGVPQWPRFAKHCNFPPFTYIATPNVYKRLGGNGMHVGVVGSIWSIVLTELVLKPNPSPRITPTHAHIDVDDDGECDVDDDADKIDVVGVNEDMAAEA
jgi:hypothetical protein